MTDSNDPFDATKAIDQALDLSNDPALVVEVVPSSTRMIQGYPIPDGAQRVRVTDEKGKACWRRLDAVLPTDTIDLTGKGHPQWMYNQVGRPKTQQLHEIVPPATAVIGDLIRARQALMRSDPVILAAESTPESPEVLNQVLIALSEEAASLRFERLEAERNGNDTSPFSVRRVAALKAIGDAWIKRKEQIQSREIDLESPVFGELLKLISETFARSMVEAGVRQEMMDTVFAKFTRQLDDTWKNEAKSRMAK